MQLLCQDIFLCRSCLQQSCTNNISVTAPSSLPTWHIAVGAGRDVARRAAAGLGGHAAGHGVQDQDDGVDEGRVRADQPAKRTDVNPNRRSTYSSTDVRHYRREQREGGTHVSSMLGSVNCTNKSLSWSTPEKVRGV